MRYNRGGRSDVAKYFAGLIKGNYQQGQIFNQDFNNRGNIQFISYFSDEAEAINVNKLVVITSPTTCEVAILIKVLVQLIGDSFSKISI